ncbi:MAG: GNAT family N-acetyltransferase [Acidimicrobiaceae bacterium]|nr:GNAT family N-acetyltransferase [Acidimicrobiaceae bacterium]
MGDSEIVIRLLETADEMSAVGTMFQQVWGSVTPLVETELLCAIAHSGGYVIGAFDGPNIVGASFGFLGRHDGHEALHSHVTGILPGVQHTGVGRSIKEHQRAWAAERGIPWITWTFDPLVRRNAWFNIEVLGATVAEYLENFYGRMGDAINGDDDSDRLLVAWPTDPDAGRPTPPPGSRIIEIATPDDIVRLRRTDIGGATEWRRRVRTELGTAIDAGGVVTGFTRDGAYQVAVSP